MAYEGEDGLQGRRWPAREKMVCKGEDGLQGRRWPTREKMA